MAESHMDSKIIGLPNSSVIGTEEKADELMGFTLQYYLKYHDMVREKLELARAATAKSVEEISEICTRFELDENMQPFRHVKAYEDRWNEIIRLFRLQGVSEEDLHRIEDILVTVPKAIKSHYDAMLAQNHLIKEIMQELNSSDYQKALKIARDIQNQPNPMSGLTPEEYEDELLHAQEAKEKKEKAVSKDSFKIVIAKH